VVKELCLSNNNGDQQQQLGSCTENPKREASQPEPAGKNKGFNTFKGN
jgi:hypothetical protein